MTKKTKMLKSIILCACTASLTFGFVACSPSSGDTAQKRLTEARKLYLLDQYEEAEQAIDTLNILFPKSFAERKAGVALLDSIRRSSNVQTISKCDSLLAQVEPIINGLEKNFIYDINKKYQDTGTYIPKKTPTSGVIAYTTLKSGVTQDGVFFIESVFIGTQRHNQISVTVAGGETRESLVVNDDGLNYTFKNLGKQFEIVRFAGNDSNGIGRLVSENVSKKVTVNLIGKSKNSFVLNNSLKEAIAQSFELSTQILYADSLKSAKEKAEFKIRYLDNREEVTQMKKDLEKNNESMRTAGNKE